MLSSLINRAAKAAPFYIENPTVLSKYLQDVIINTIMELNYTLPEGHNWFSGKMTSMDRADLILQTSGLHNKIQSTTDIEAFITLNKQIFKSTSSTICDLEEDARALHDPAKNITQHGSIGYIKHDFRECTINHLAKTLRDFKADPEALPNYESLDKATKNHGKDYREAAFGPSISTRLEQYALKSFHANAGGLIPDDTDKPSSSSPKPDSKAQSRPKNNSLNTAMAEFRFASGGHIPDDPIKNSPPKKTTESKNTKDGKPSLASRVMKAMENSAMSRDQFHSGGNLE